MNTPEALKKAIKKQIGFSIVGLVLLMVFNVFTLPLVLALGGGSLIGIGISTLRYSRQTK